MNKKNVLMYSLLIAVALIVNVGIYNSVNAVPFGDQQKKGTDCVNAQTGEKLWDCHDCIDGGSTCVDESCTECEPIVPE